MKPSDSRVRTIALVGCVKSKLTTRTAARDLYTSPLFRKSRRFAETHADAWFVLSALHGLLHPAEVILPYEVTLNTMNTVERRAWAEGVHGQLSAAGLIDDRARLLWLAGNAYQQPLRSMLAHQPHLDPLRGLRMGERMRWLNENT